MTAAVQESLLDLAAGGKQPRKRAPKARKPKPTVGTTARVEYTTDVDGEGRRQWTLTFPAPAEMPSVNSGRQHWRRTAPIHKTWRETTFVHAKAAKLPTGLARVRIDVSLRFPSHGRRDAGNYYTHVVKPLVDALGPPIDKMRAGKRVLAVGYGLIPDDTAEFLDGPFVTLGQKCDDPRVTPFGSVEVVVTELVVAS